VYHPDWMTCSPYHLKALILPLARNGFKMDGEEDFAFKWRMLAMSSDHLEVTGDLTLMMIL
jgi:hypothetical protein